MIFRGVGMEQTTSRGNNVHRAAIAPVSLTEAIIYGVVYCRGRKNVSCCTYVVVPFCLIYQFTIFTYVVYVRMHHPHLINQ